VSGVLQAGEVAVQVTRRLEEEGVMTIPINTERLECELWDSVG
jgi:hypothetical protein